MNAHVYTISSAPGVEPITASNAKMHCRIDTTADDTLLDAYIATARQHVEDVTKRALITQTWAMYLGEWPAGDVIEIGKPPLQSVTSVLYYDTDDTEYTLSTDDYSVDTDSTPGRIVLGYGKSWPSVTLRPDRPIKITFKAGYGDAGTAVPSTLLHAIRIAVAHWYENREPAYIGTGNVLPVPMAFDALVFPYRWRL